MSHDSSDGYPLVLHTEADPSRLGGTAICGFSTVGSVGVIATSHLIKSLDLNPMGTVLHPKFPAVALIHDSVPKHPVRVYQGRNKDKDPIATIFQSAMVELIKTKSKSTSVQSARVSRVLEISADKEIKLIERHFTFLATVGSTAPFIGLFGTVWGIMNSFQSIAISRNTSLAIVAPGIAEALFATALGLLAAVPAVIAYNKFNSDSKRYSGRIENFSKRFLSII